jgi:hypothetical protein
MLANKCTSFPLKVDSLIAHKRCSSSSELKVSVETSLLFPIRPIEVNYSAT